MRIMPCRDVPAKVRCMRPGTAATIQMFGAQESVTHAMAVAIKFANSAGCHEPAIAFNDDGEALCEDCLSMDGLSLETSEGHYRPLLVTRQEGARLCQRCCGEKCHLAGRFPGRKTSS